MRLKSGNMPAVSINSDLLVQSLSVRRFGGWKQLACSPFQAFAGTFLFLLLLALAVMAGCQTRSFTSGLQLSSEGVPAQSGQPSASCEGLLAEGAPKSLGLGSAPAGNMSDKDLPVHNQAGNALGLEFGFEVELYPQPGYNPLVVCLYEPLTKPVGKRFAWDEMDLSARLKQAHAFIESIRLRPEHFKKPSFKMTGRAQALGWDSLLPLALTQESTGKIEADLGHGPRLEPFALMLDRLERLFGPLQVQGHLTFPLPLTGTPAEALWKRLATGYPDYMLAASDRGLLYILEREHEEFARCSERSQTESGATGSIACRLPAEHFVSQTLRPPGESALAHFRSLALSVDPLKALAKFSADQAQHNYAAPVLRDAATYGSDQQRFGLEFRQYDFPSVGLAPLGAIWPELVSALRQTSRSVAQNQKFPQPPVRVEPAGRNTFFSFRDAVEDVLTRPTQPPQPGSRSSAFGLSSEKAQRAQETVFDLVGSADASEQIRKLQTTFQRLLEGAATWQVFPGVPLAVTWSVVYPLRPWHLLFEAAPADSETLVRRKLNAAELYWQATADYLGWLLNASRKQDLSTDRARESLDEFRVRLAKWAKDSDLLSALELAESE